VNDYDALRDYLTKQTLPEFVLTFEQIEAIIDAEAAAEQVTDSVRNGVRRARAIDLPEEAEPIRAAVREFIARIADLDDDARR